MQRLGRDSFLSSKIRFSSCSHAVRAISSCEKSWGELPSRAACCAGVSRRRRSTKSSDSVAAADGLFAPLRSTDCATTSSRAFCRLFLLPRWNVATIPRKLWSKKNGLDRPHVTVKYFCQSTMKVCVCGKILFQQDFSHAHKNYLWLHKCQQSSIVLPTLGGNSSLTTCNLTPTRYKNNTWNPSNSRVNNLIWTDLVPA